MKEEEKKETNVLEKNKKKVGRIMEIFLGK